MTWLPRNRKVVNPVIKVNGLIIKCLSFSASNSVSLSVYAQKFLLTALLKTGTCVGTTAASGCGCQKPSLTTATRSTTTIREDTQVSKDQVMQTKSVIQSSKSNPTFVQ